LTAVRREKIFSGAARFRRLVQRGGPSRRMHVIQIKKNVAIIGGFLALLVAGGGKFAVSAWSSRRH